MGVASPSPQLAPAEALARLRQTQPMVQCVTNAVVTGFTANTLLALGATPAMVDLPGEAGPFAALADASLVNVGTPGAEQREGAREVAAASRRWVLDPVAVGSLPIRTALAREMLLAGPSVVRGNASEVLALAGAGAGGRGVDALDGTDTAQQAAQDLSHTSSAVIAVSGEVDLVTDGTTILRVHGGSELLTRVTGGGCSLGATTAAFLAVCTPLSAAVAAALVHKLAAERAAAGAGGPGSFAVGFLDALAALTPDDVAAVSPSRVLKAGVAAEAVSHQKQGARR